MYYEETKEERDLRRHGFILPRTPEKPLSKKGREALEEWASPPDDSEDGPDGF
jgi:hypothetical protein